MVRAGNESNLNKEDKADKGHDSVSIAVLFAVIREFDKLSIRVMAAFVILYLFNRVEEYKYALFATLC